MSTKEEKSNIQNKKSFDKLTCVFLIVYIFIICLCVARIANYTIMNFFIVFSCFLIFSLLLAILIGNIEKFFDKRMLAHCKKMLCPGCGSNFEIERSDIKRWMARTMYDDGICRFSKGITIYCKRCNKTYRFDKL